MLNSKKKSAIILSAAIIIIVAIVLTVFLISTAGINARAQEIERDLSAVEAEVDAIDLSGIAALSDTKALIEQSKQLAGIGIGGVPMLMNKLETEEMPGVRRMFYTECQRADRKGQQRI